jgi:hypothetical protein
VKAPEECMLVFPNVTGILMKSFPLIAPPLTDDGQKYFAGV